MLVLYGHCQNNFRPPPLSNGQRGKKSTPNYLYTPPPPYGQLVMFQATLEYIVTVCNILVHFPLFNKVGFKVRWGTCLLKPHTSAALYRARSQNITNHVLVLKNGHMLLTRHKYAPQVVSMWSMWSMLCIA